MSFYICLRNKGKQLKRLVVFLKVTEGVQLGDNFQVCTGLDKVSIDSPYSVNKLTVSVTYGSGTQF